MHSLSISNHLLPYAFHLPNIDGRLSGGKALDALLFTWWICDMRNGVLVCVDEGLDTRPIQKDLHPVKRYSSIRFSIKVTRT